MLFVYSAMGDYNSIEIHAEEGGRCDPADTIWKCEVCGKKNHEEAKIQTHCITCGRQKGYVGSKKIQVLNQYRLDLMPHATVATKDEMAKAKLIETKRVSFREGGKQSLFLSNRTDFEVIERAEIKDETSSVLATIRSTLENKS